MADLKKPHSRNIFFAHQVDQDKINDVSKTIIEIREHDEFFEKIIPIVWA